MTERIDFIAELLRESDEAEATKKIEMDRLRADQLLTAIGILEDQMNDVTELVDKEMKLLEEYRSSELSRLDKKRSWLVFNLEAYARSTGEKTMRLQHGILKLRKGSDKVAVIAMEQSLEKAQSLGFLRTVPESYLPDTQAVLAHIKRTVEVPPGVQFIPAETKFSYTTNGAHDEQQRERDETEG
jgi:phosphatidylinositol kinase/protein kinase (PI-3  family)